MKNRAICEKCVFFKNDRLRPFCKAFGVYMSNERAARAMTCAAFIDKRKDGLQIKQVIFDEREGDK